MKNRSNSRSQRKTSLIYGEGIDEEKFLNHLKNIYSRSGIRFRPEAGSGGSAEQVVISAIKFCSNGQFDYRVVVFDGDCPTTSAAIILAKENGLFPIVFSPCLDGMLLELLGLQVSDTFKCDPNKSAIKRKLGDTIHRLSIDTLKKRFPKEAIEDYAKNKNTSNSSELKTLLKESKMVDL